MDYTSFAQIIANPELFERIKKDNPECAKVNNMILVATAGVRQNVPLPTQQDFYKQLIKEVDKKSHTLIAAETITEDQEGKFAWRSIKTTQSLEGDFTSIDMGGSSMQITNQTHSVSFNLGKDVVKEQIGPENLKYCYGNDNLYNGTFCRKKAAEFLNIDSLPQLSNQHQIFAISSFENCFNDICGTFLPILSAPLNTCNSKQQKLGPFTLNVEDYKNIAEDICHLWPKNWDISAKKYQYAADACFSLNYLYELSHKLGLEDDHELHIYDADWTLGAMTHFLGSSQYSTHTEL